MYLNSCAFNAKTDTMWFWWFFLNNCAPIRITQMPIQYQCRSPRTISNRHISQRNKISIINITYWYVQHAATLLFSIYMNYTARFGFNRVWNILFDYVHEFSIHFDRNSPMLKHFKWTVFFSLSVWFMW